MKALVGYTGFVGSNLAAYGNFDGLYNSKNVKEAYGTNPDVLFYSGVPAQKFIANKFPQQDFETVVEALDNMKKINPKKVMINFLIELEGLKGRDIFPADTEIDCLLTLEGK